jgi:small-conductance mechanosensitive channel
MGETPTVLQYILPLILIMAGFAVGLILEAILYSIFCRFAAGKTWEASSADVKVLRGVVVLWTTLAGIYAAVSYMSIRPGIENVVGKAMLAAVILSVAFILAQVAVAVIRFYTRRTDGAGRSTSILTNLTRLIIFIVGALVVLDQWGISIMPALTALGVAGLAVALALQSTLANLFAGLQLLASKQIKLGDYVKLDSGEEGYVTDITWRTTTIRTLQNNITFVPNSKMASAAITNFAQPDEAVNVFVQVGIAPSGDLAKVEQAVVEVAKALLKEVQGGIPEFEPRLHFNAITETSVNCTVELRAKGFGDQSRIKDEFIKRLTARLQKEGVLKSVSA